MCGLAIGVPREMPDLKPKQPVDAVVHHNRYASDEVLVENLTNYDNEISAYNRTRSGTTSDNDWCGHILDYYRAALSYEILDYLKSQGFNPEK